MAGGGGDAAGDEEAIESAIDFMLSACGNAGQQTIIERNSDAFFEWGLAALEEEGAFDGFEEMLDALDVSSDDHSLEGTIQIWRYGFEELVHQSAFHDSTDEGGEGTGENVAGSTDFI